MSNRQATCLKEQKERDINFGPPRQAAGECSREVGKESVVGNVHW